MVAIPMSDHATGGESVPHYGHLGYVASCRQRGLNEIFASRQAVEGFSLKRAFPVTSCRV